MVIRQSTLSNSSVCRSSSGNSAKTPNQFPTVMDSQSEPEPQVYSPNLHQSPAFDLQTLDQAQQRTPGDQVNPWLDAADRTPLPLPGALQAGRVAPNSNTSSAFKDLPDLPKWGGHNNDTPRSSLDSQRSKGFWDDADDTDQPLKQRPEKAENVDSSRQPPQPLPVSSPQPPKKPEHPTVPSFQSPNYAAAQPPAPGLVKRKPVSGTDMSANVLAPRSSSFSFASNNPFRDCAMSNGVVTPIPDLLGDEGVTSGSGDQLDGLDKGKQAIRDMPASMVAAQMTANLSVDDRPFSEFSPSFRPSNIDLGSEYRARSVEDGSHPTHAPPHPAGPPPPVPLADIDEQPPLIPVTSSAAAEDNPWASVEHLDETRSRTPDKIENGGQNLTRTQIFSRDQETGIIPINVPTKSRPAEPKVTNPQPFIASPWHDEEPGPPLPTRRPTEQQYDSLTSLPPTPPRPQAQGRSMVEEALERLKGQRHETYQIKHFNWFDHHTGSLRRSSMLTQNKNGPCPLLALVNALILGKPDDSQSALGCALEAREQVSLGLLIESLMDELTSENQIGALETLPDVDEINRFLVMLHTGMNANPRFVPPPAPPPNLMDARNSALHLPTVINDDLKPGTFEQTRDLILYGAFAVPLVHGWLPKRSDSARAAFARAAPTYEDAQTIQFGEEELEGKLSQGGLTSEEQQLWEDIVSIRTFLAAHPTQLTPFGLNVVSESLFPGAFAIMFRNDHFSTIYKHPQSGQLFTLVTDAGYADKDEVIWESLVDVSGSRSEFFSGDFRPVGGAEGQLDTPQHDSITLTPLSTDRRSSSQYLPATHSAAPLSPQEIQEQHDADFAMALQLQEEEESRATNNSRRRTTQTRSSNTDRSSNIPIRVRPPQDTGPAIPPRTSRSAMPAVNRSVNLADEAPPPTYDEAAKGAPYIPPPGHPQHPSSDPSPQSSTTTIPITPIATSSAQQTRPVRVPQQRRMSAFLENQQQYSPRYESMRSSSNQHVGPVASGSRQRDRVADKDCTIM